MRTIVTFDQTHGMQIITEGVDISAQFPSSPSQDRFELSAT
jgi:hypothetical protein